MINLIVPLFIWFLIDLIRPSIQSNEIQFLISTILIHDVNSLFYSVSIFLISFLSNTFSAISGGGAGLLQLPSLILFGVPYSQALAIHKLATVSLGIGGSLRNYKSLRNDICFAWQILIFGLPGVIFGTSIIE